MSLGFLVTDATYPGNLSVTIAPLGPLPLTICLYPVPVAVISFRPTHLFPKKRKLQHSARWIW